ncbi:acid protease [Crucibulum laeve]|uniref:Acid protease n=1 Tax=Crucibulum laeve TaxID=68775 RepID=A0A5C3MES2_9AGAR|nr:acid protease [Crucibulum laeve]
MRASFVQLVALLPLLAYAVPTTHVGVTVPLTKRTTLVDDEGVIRPAALNKQLTRITNKLARGFNAFEKNTGSAHPSDTKTLAKRATGSDRLTDDQDGALWQGAISVGTPAVSFTVDFDTGSSDLFLPGANCRVNCQGHKVFNTASSSTARDLRKTFSLAFGDGSTVQGEQFSDTVTVAGVTVTGQTVGAATQYSTGFALDEFPPDGLMGMAFEQISVFGANPFFQTAVAQGKPTASEFGVKLAATGSELFLGGVDTSLASGAFTQLPVTEVGFWQVNLDAVNANGRAAVSKLSAIVDTGTTLIVGDPTNVAKFYSAITGSKDASATVGDGFFTVPCNAIPTVSLTFGGKAFTVSAATFNLGRVSANSNDCVGGITAADLGDFWVVGDVFLQNVYISFDVGNKRVGFANLA